MSSNPFADRFEQQPQQPGLVSGPLAPLESVDYFAAVSAVFQDPHWTSSLLLGGVVFLVASALGNCVPCLGVLLQPIVVVIIDGFGADLSVSVLESHGAATSPFDFNRLGDYFGRAAGRLVWNFLLLIVSFAVTFGLLFAMGPNRGQPPGPDDDVRVGVVIFAMIGFWGAFYFVLSPALLKSGFTGRFTDAFDFPWALDFVSRMWVEMLVGAFFMVLLAIAASIVGLLLLIIGVLLVYPFMTMFRAHFDAQLYRVYVTRGGVPIPLQPSLYRFAAPMPYPTAFGQTPWQPPNAPPSDNPYASPQSSNWYQPPKP